MHSIFPRHWLGLTGVVLIAGAMSVTASVTEAAEFATPSFRNDVMAVLSKAGCNLGTCHGNANGKGGLKLSLRGQDPDGDFLTLTRRVSSRRVNALRPEESLLLLKPLMLIPHEGGRRFQAESVEFQILRDWMRAGQPRDSSEAPRLQSLEVRPSHVTIVAPESQVQLTVEATFSNGLRRDVARLATYEPSATTVSVSEDGLATANRPGQVSVTVRYLDQQVPVRLEFVPDRPDFVSSDLTPANEIDVAVFQQLRRLKINPAESCDDVTFLRRVYLDLTGLLPTESQARAFFASTAADKRLTLIDDVLSSPTFNDMQALRWADLLRVEEKTLDAKGVEVFHHWIRNAFAQDKPLNEMAKELLEARGSTYKVPAANLYRSLRDPESRAESIAQVFLGVRLQCAKCHNHPFDRWTQDDYYGWSNYFARIDYEIVENKRRDKFDKHEFDGEQVVLIKPEGEVKHPLTQKPAALKLLGDHSVEAPEAGKAERDRTQLVAHWMADARNDRFATTQANRLWSQLMGRGIVEPVDDFRATNPASNPELLQVLKQEFVRGGFRVRPLMKFILSSRTYQLSSVPNGTNRDDDTQFARAIIRRLTAEQTLDAVAQVLGVSARFGGQKSGLRAVQLPGVRNGGHRYSAAETGDRFLAVFGKPGRLLTCECERSNDSTLAQTFELISGELMQELLTSDRGLITEWLRAKKLDQDIVASMYWSALSRDPNSTERNLALQHLSQQSDRRRAIEDIAWAILNSNEFLLRR